MADRRKQRRNRESSAERANSNYVLAEAVAECPCELIPDMLRDGERRRRENIMLAQPTADSKTIVAEDGSIRHGEVSARPKPLFRSTKGRGPWPPMWTQSWHWHWCYRLIDHVTQAENGPDHMRTQLTGERATYIEQSINDLLSDWPKDASEADASWFATMPLEDTPEARERLAAMLEVVADAHACRQNSEDEYQRTRAGHVRRFLSAMWGVEVPAKRDPHHVEWDGDEPLPALVLDHDLLDKWVAKAQRRWQREREQQERADARLIEMARDAGFTDASLAQLVTRVSEKGGRTTAVEIIREVAEGRSEDDAIKNLARIRLEAVAQGWIDPLPGDDAS